MHCGNSRCDWSVTWPLSNMTRSLARGRNFKFQHRHHLPNGPQVISIQILTELYKDQIWIAPSFEICPEMHALAKMAELVNNGKIVNKISNEMAKDPSESDDFGENGGFGENASTTAMIFFHIILHPAVLIYDFHIFITSSSSFHGFLTKQFIDLFPVGLLAHLVERCTGISEAKGSNPVQA